MSYSITYQWDREPAPSPQHSVLSNLLPGLILITGALMLRYLVPEMDEIVRRLFHPLMDADTMEAVGALTDQLMDGVPLEKAVTAFCVQILEHG